MMSHIRVDVFVKTARTVTSRERVKNDDERLYRGCCRCSGGVVHQHEEKRGDMPRRYPATQIYCGL